MTLVLCALSRNTLWVLTDRRLSYGAARPPVDDAIKMTTLETLDGVGVLAYAGLGATAAGTYPSAWMSAVLRGRGGLPFEQTLGFVADAATKELPRHLRRIPGGAHFILVPAFIKDVGPRLYSIDNVLDPATGEHRFRYTRHQRSTEANAPAVQLALAGSGAVHLAAKPPSWARRLRSTLKANDKGKVSDLHVADALAALSYECYENTPDGSVGPRSIVIWRRRQGVNQLPGSAHQSYTGRDRDTDMPVIPSVANGLDVSAIVGVLMGMLDGVHANGFDSAAMGSMFEDVEEINSRLAETPSDPDDRLR
ncbi:hypothetical protein BJF90_31970 [Pseudonocardia sp. CNS-004]|nr:hypothetical protein BJF90_31970 [Pseudonocardia sp. CNS-004]